MLLWLVGTNLNVSLFCQKAQRRRVRWFDKKAEKGRGGGEEEAGGAAEGNLKKKKKS